MSLINDALKKAQRQRTGDSPLSQPPMPGGTPAPARPARGNNSPSPQLLLVGVGAVLGLLLATGAILFFRPKSTAPESAGASSAEQSKPQTNAVASSAPLPSPPAAQTPPASSQPSPVAVLAAAKPAESLPVVKTTPSSAAATASEPRAPVDQISPHATATSPASPTAPPAPSLRMIEAIEALRVAGIRASAGTDAKVLMNDRVYRIGDTVDHALGIKLTAVTASSLTFSDASGASYTRHF